MSERGGIAIATYSTQPRGGVVHAVAVAEALHDLGEDVVLFALDDGRGFARAPRCPYRLISVARATGDLEELVRSRAEAYVRALSHPDERRFAVYHAQDGISGNALATLVERGTIASYGRTVHHIDAFADPRVEALQRRSIERAAWHLTVSATWAGRLLADYGVAATVVGNGVDPRFAVPADLVRRSARARYGEEGQAPLFAAIGGIEARKNALGALEAFDLVRATAPRARLVIAGGASVFDHGAYRARFEARRGELGLEAAVTLLGECRDVEIESLLHAADALVFPSFAEGFGLVALEALASGIPVVVSAIEPFLSYLPPALARFVDPGDSRSIADGMRRACEPGFTRHARERGPAFAARYPWSRVAEAHLLAYRRARREPVRA